VIDTKVKVPLGTGITNEGSRNPQPADGERPALAVAGTATNEVSMEALESDMERCKKSAKKLRTSVHKANEALHRHLTDVYALGASELTDTAIIKKHCLQSKVAWTRATQANADIATFKLCNPRIDGKQARRYETVLTFARLRRVQPDRLPEFIKRKGGVDGCARMFRELQIEDRDDD
jgi:hypothetical protein